LLKSTVHDGGNSPTGFKGLKQFKLCLCNAGEVRSLVSRWNAGSFWCDSPKMSSSVITRCYVTSRDIECDVRSEQRYWRKWLGACAACDRKSAQIITWCL